MYKGLFINIEGYKLKKGIVRGPAAAQWHYLRCHVATTASLDCKARIDVPLQFIEHVSQLELASRATDQGAS